MRGKTIRPRFARRLVYLVLILGAFGCNLPQRAVVTITPQPTSLPAATPAPSGSVPPAQATTAPEGCAAPADWVEYTVQPGDTLTLIAELRNTTIDELVTANCLEDPDRLERGQTLRVPRLPGE